MALVFCLATLTAGITAGKNNTHKLALQHVCECICLQCCKLSACGGVEYYFLENIIQIGLPVFSASAGHSALYVEDQSCLKNKSLLSL